MGSTRDVIELTANRTRVLADDVLFTFPDGRLEYDCVACGAQCCRGHGYDFKPGAELQAQLSDQPFVRFFVGERRGLPVMRNLRPACFFLTDEDRCGLHARHGRAAKPQTCRLFPFNRFGILGSHLIVGPHTNLCPLEVTPRDRRSDASRHAVLRRELVETGISARVEPVSARLSDAETLFELERQIVALADTCLERGGDFGDFVQRQVSITQDLTPQLGGLGGVLSTSVPSWRDIAAVLLGVDHDSLFEPDPELDRALVVGSPALRAQIVFDSKGEALRDPWSLQRVPYSLLGLHVMARLARLAGMPAIGFRTLCQLAATHRPLIWVLAHADVPMTWRRNVAIELPPATVDGAFRMGYVGLAKALTRRRGRAGDPLGSVIARFNAWKDLEAIRFLNLVSDRLVGRLEPRCLEPSRRSSLRHPRAAVGQLFLSVLPQTMMRQVAERSARRN